MALAHFNLGADLQIAGRRPWRRRRIAKKPPRLDPVSADAYMSLGASLKSLGDVPEAIAAYRQATQLKPDHALAHFDLGRVLQEAGRFQDAAAELSRGHDLGSGKPGWPQPGSGQFVGRARRLADVEAKLPAILAGRDQARNDAERADLVTVAYSKALHVASARFAKEALAALPPAETKQSLSLRYDGACSALLASLGQGEDEARPDEAGRDLLRRQALEWFNAELDVWAAAIERRMPDMRPTIVSKMRHWKADKDLDAFRGDAALAKLPANERQQWSKLWERVETLLRQASSNSVPSA